MNDGPEMPTRDDYKGPNARNPFLSDVPATRPVGSIANAEQQRSIAEVQARMIIARSNPRDPMRCMDLILRDCTRPSLAEKSLYQYARGGSSISGPSIRLAEAIAQRWGNIASGIKEISRAHGYSECVAYAWDLESGFYDERQYQVKHWRDTRQGGHPITDEREIYELVANLGQRRKRAVLLTVIPGDVVEAAQDQCEETLRTTADTSPEALARIIAAFEQYGVTKAQLEKRCQCRFEAVRPAQIVQLRKIYASLKDGMSEPADWFEAVNGTWLAVDQAHEAAKPATETRTAPRKAAQKKAAASEPEPPKQTPAEDGIPFDRWDEEQSRPASDASQPVAEGGPDQSIGQTALGPTPGEIPGTKAPAFSAWLVDGEGNENPDADGVVDPYTDPIAFAHAYVDALANEFPGTIELFKRANHDSLAQAMIVSTEVAPILTAGQPARPAQPAPTAPDFTAAGGPDLFGEGQPAPVDPAFIAIPSPIKLTKAVMDDFNKRLGQLLEGATKPHQINHIIDVNAPTYEAFSPSGRLGAKALIEARQKAISPAPPREDAPATDTSETIARDLAHDVYSLVSIESINAWEKLPAVFAKMDALAKADPAYFEQVTDATRNRRDELHRDIADRILEKVRGARSLPESAALASDVDVISGLKTLNAEAPTLAAQVKQEAIAKRDELAKGGV